MLYWTKIQLKFYKILNKTLLTKECLHWKDGCWRFESIMIPFRIQTNDTYTIYSNIFCFSGLTYTWTIFHLSRNKSPYYCYYLDFDNQETICQNFGGSIKHYNTKLIWGWDRNQYSNMSTDRVSFWVSVKVSCCYVLLWASYRLFAWLLFCSIGCEILII